MIIKLHCSRKITIWSNYGLFESKMLIIGFFLLMMIVECWSRIPLMQDLKMFFYSSQFEETFIASSNNADCNLKKGRKRFISRSKSRIYVPNSKHSTSICFNPRVCPWFRAFYFSSEDVSTQQLGNCFKLPRWVSHFWDFNILKPKIASLIRYGSKLKVMRYKI